MNIIHIFAVTIVMMMMSTIVNGFKLTSTRLAVKKSLTRAFLFGNAPDPNKSNKPEQKKDLFGGMGKLLLLLIDVLLLLT